MDQVLQFLENNWTFVIEIVFTLVILLVSLFKKKTTISVNGLNQVLMALPGYINRAEIFYGSGHGDEKFKFVFHLAYEQLQEYYPDEVIKSHNFSLILTAAIENILTTPVKKEDNFNG